MYKGYKGGGRVKRRNISKKPLLTIELKEAHSIPVVKYKGEEITMEQSINFEWETDREYPEGVWFRIQHLMREGNQLEQRCIEHRTGSKKKE